MRNEKAKKVFKLKDFLKLKRNFCFYYITRKVYTMDTQILQSCFDFCVVFNIQF